MTGVTQTQKRMVCKRDGETIPQERHTQAHRQVDTAIQPAAPGAAGFFFRPGNETERGKRHLSVDAALDACALSVVGFSTRRRAWQTVNELACGESGIVHGAECIAVLNGVA